MGACKAYLSLLMVSAAFSYYGFSFRVRADSRAAVSATASDIRHGTAGHHSGVRWLVPQNGPAGRGDGRYSPDRSLRCWARRWALFVNGRRQNRDSANSMGGVMTRPIRILHVVGGMDRGGVETWLMHVLRNIDRERFHMDFLVHTDRSCAYDDEIIMGSRLHVCPFTRNPLKYVRGFARALREHGPYDVVHSHVHHTSGLTLRLAKRAGVRIRIAHSHSDTSTVDSASHLLRRLQLWLGHRWIQRYASRKIAVSSGSAESLFGPAWRSDSAASILYCGIDLVAFRSPVDRASARLEMGIAPDHFVIGHVGRFDRKITIFSCGYTPKY